MKTVLSSLSLIFILHIGIAAQTPIGESSVYELAERIELGAAAFMPEWDFRPVMCTCEGLFVHQKARVMGQWKKEGKGEEQDISFALHQSEDVSEAIGWMERLKRGEIISAEGGTEYDVGEDSYLINSGKGTTAIYIRNGAVIVMVQGRPAVLVKRLAHLAAKEMSAS